VKKKVKITYFLIVGLLSQLSYYSHSKLYIPCSALFASKHGYNHYINPPHAYASFLKFLTFNTHCVTVVHLSHPTNHFPQVQALLKPADTQ